MNRLILIVFLSLLVGCKHHGNYKKISRNPDGTVAKTEIKENERFSEEGEFVYNAQEAHFEKNEIECMGVCTLEKFENMFNQFNWKKQLAEANIKKSVMPTIAVRHNLTRYELGISAVGKDTTDLRFLISFGKMGKIKSMNSIVLSDEYNVHLIISKFFNKDFEELESLFKKDVAKVN